MGERCISMHLEIQNLSAKRGEEGRKKRRKLRKREKKMESKGEKRGGEGRRGEERKGGEERRGKEERRGDLLLIITRSEVFVN